MATDATGPPGPGLIRFRRIAVGCPGFGNGVNPFPRLFYFVAANEQRLDATHGFQQQTFIGIGQVRLIKGLRNSSDPV